LLITETVDALAPNADWFGCTWLVVELAGYAVVLPLPVLFPATAELLAEIPA
jgi:hypothetical protein